MWVIQQILAVPKRKGKNGKWIHQRKKVSKMYRHCWEKLMNQKDPPGIKNLKQLKDWVRKWNERQRELLAGKMHFMLLTVL